MLLNLDETKVFSVASSEKIKKKLKLNQILVSSTSSSTSFPSIFTSLSNNFHLFQLSSSLLPLKDLTLLERNLTSSTPQLLYRRRRGEIKSLIHWGQRKLLISEIEFLNKYSKKGFLCLYVGAAPGIHISYLSQLFPTISFVLIDPAKFQCEETKQIQIRNEYMTDEIAREYQNQNLLFISDIRSADWKLLGNDVLDNEIIQDMNNQMKWHDIMSPIASMMKFRLPWKEGITNYLQGDIYFPIWGPQTTTESRLIVTGHERKDWDHRVYWEQMFYFNNVLRCSAYHHMIPIEYRIGKILIPTVLSREKNHENEDDDEEEIHHINKEEEKNHSNCQKMSCCIDYCYDCSAEIIILREYLLNRLQNEKINDDEGILIGNENVFLKYHQLTPEDKELEIIRVIRIMIDQISESCLSQYRLGLSNDNNHNDNDNYISSCEKIKTTTQNLQIKKNKKRKQKELNNNDNNIASFFQTTEPTLELLQNCIRYPFIPTSGNNNNNNNNNNNVDSFQQQMELKNNSYDLWINMNPPNMIDLSLIETGKRGTLNFGYNIPLNCALDIWLWRLLECSVLNQTASIPGSNLQNISLNDLQMTNEQKFELFTHCIKNDEPISLENQQRCFPIISTFTDSGQTFFYHFSSNLINRISCTQISIPPSTTPHLPTICLGYITQSSLESLSSNWSLSLSRILVFYGMKRESFGQFEDDAILKSFINVTFDRSLSWKEQLFDLLGLKTVDIYSINKS